MTEADLQKAMALAVRIHEGQTDLQGLPYVYHPFRVAARLALWLPTLDPETAREIQAAALLHDVLEDQPDRITLADLREMFPDAAGLVATLTHEKGKETYREYIQRVGFAGAAARAIKLADLWDNLDPARDPGGYDALHLRHRRAVAYLWDWAPGKEY